MNTIDSKAYRINGFEQIKAFYSIVFNSEFDIRPSHVSLYIFLLNQNNRNLWIEWFKCPFDLAMQGALISSKTTYYKILDDLVDFKLIEYRKGINNFKAPQIRIIPLTVSKNDTQSVPLTVPQSEPVNIPLTVQLPDHIYKLITNNLKPITDNYKIFEEFVLSLSQEGKIIIEEEKRLKTQFEIFRQSYPGTKRGFDPEFENFVKKNKNWHEIVPILSDALTYQKAAREVKKQAGGFVPEWKNLQTWINQKCWEEEIETNNISNGKHSKNTGATERELAEHFARKYGTNSEAGE